MGYGYPAAMLTLILSRRAGHVLQYHLRDGGKAWDTVKPLGGHGFCLHTTILVDNDVHKAVAGEEQNMLLVPDWLGDPGSCTALEAGQYDAICCCGPLVVMVAVWVECGGYNTCGHSEV